MIKTVVIGAAGRMGRMLLTQVLNTPELKLVGATEIPGSPFIGQDAGIVSGNAATGVAITDNIDAALSNADVLIDFTIASATRALIPIAGAKGINMVIGTTALTAEDKAALADWAKKGLKIVCAPNMSVGVNLLFALCAKVAPLLGADYDIEIVEMHHNKKKDAPSGTAERLGEILAAATGLDYEKDTRHGRVGMVGARTRHEIGMHSLRGGDVVGDHTVIFATEGERVELTHKASSRECFAKGAIRAVKYIGAPDRQPGLYDMQDVLGLK
ncbi:MAG: 4-hydroxy-tetrahydrodipicolinate reductase [Victivallales bacterium]|nr:4-hydroxy-tetrahydrodipicolinate reductase [Victivallales bacterium]